MAGKSLLTLSVCSLLLASACIDREVAKVPPNINKEQMHDIPLSRNRNVDILFVIDNSGSMAAEQTSLKNNFGLFVQELESITGGMPDSHIGIISTDVGAGSVCPNSDGGQLQSTPRGGCALSGPSDRYIVTIDEGDTRRTNFPASQSLADTFACIAELGTLGCGFEQPLESMRLALQPENVANAGFLREDAWLAIVFITDEDDCSAANLQLFDGAENEQFGRRKSFRCFEHSIRCNPDDPRSLGSKSDCTIREDDDYMRDVQAYVDMLIDLKGDPDKVIVAGIIGSPDPVRVNKSSDRDGDYLVVGKSCGEVAGDPHSGAVPALRMDAFLDSFRYSTKTSICDADMSGALVQIAELLRGVVGTRCLQGDLVDMNDELAGVQPACVVSEVSHAYQDDMDEKIIPECDAPGTPAPTSEHPCYSLVESDTCNGEQEVTDLEIKLYPENYAAASDTRLWVRCQAN